MATLLLGGGLGRYDFSVLPYMVLGAVLGGLLGARLNKRLSEKTVEHAFNAVQMLVLTLCLVNIVHNL